MHMRRLEPNGMHSAIFGALHPCPFSDEDASITHRAHYLAYLKATVLPSDMPPIDIKVKHKDPKGAGGFLDKIF
jgi:hypothetical protein